MYLDEREKRDEERGREGEIKRGREVRGREEVEGRERERVVVARRISGTLRFPLLSSRTRWNDGAGIRGHFSSVRYLFGEDKVKNERNVARFCGKIGFEGIVEPWKMEGGSIWDTFGWTSFKSEVKMIAGVD